jgi:hypothetical protein
LNLAACEEQLGNPAQAGELLAIVPEHDPQTPKHGGC